MNETAWIIQIIFDIVVIVYVVFMQYLNRREKGSFLRLTETLNTLVNSQKSLLDSTNSKMLSLENNLNALLDDVKKKNVLLSEFLSTVKNKTYKNSLRLNIMGMKNQGETVEDIAKEYGMSKGEVELIIKLYEQEDK